MDAEDFRDIVGEDLWRRLKYIRQAGNAAAHTGKKITPEQARLCLENLWYFMDFIACCYGTTYTAGTFDPELLEQQDAALAPAPVPDVDLAALMDRLGSENIDSVLLEGGGTLNWSALEQGLVQKVQAYIAPKLFGGGAAKSPVEGLGVETPDQAVRLINTTITPLGDDFLLESEVEHHVYRDR